MHRAKALEWDVEQEVPSLIGKRSRGTPRLALRLLQSCGVSAVRWASTSLPAPTWKRHVHLEGLDEEGLGPTERSNYLPLWLMEQAD